MEVPDQKGRLAILKVHAKNKKLSEDVELAQIAMRTPGFSGADLANLLNEVSKFSHTCLPYLVQKPISIATCIIRLAQCEVPLGRCAYIALCLGLAAYWIACLSHWGCRDEQKPQSTGTQPPAHLVIKVALMVGAGRQALTMHWHCIPTHQHM